MIDIATLLQDKPFKGNYFAPDAYVRGDMEFGLIENRSGSRLLALPETLLQGLHVGLAEEIGPASWIVLFSCGSWWGKNLYRRLAEELEQYYGQPLANMEMVEFLRALKECWKTHGWGTLDIDLKCYERGFLVLHLVNSPFIEAAPRGQRMMGHLEAGIFSGFFSRLTGTELHCVQTTCESLGAERNSFVVGVADRLQDVSAWLEEGHTPETILDLLCRHQ
jgi:predicted hydrocarbon binding protein